MDKSGKVFLYQYLANREDLGKLIVAIFHRNRQIRQIDLYHFSKGDELNRLFCVTSFERDEISKLKLMIVQMETI